MSAPRCYGGCEHLRIGRDVVVCGLAKFGGAAGSCVIPKNIKTRPRWCPLKMARGKETR